MAAEPKENAFATIRRLVAMNGRKAGVGTRTNETAVMQGQHHRPEKVTVKLG